MYPGVVSPQQDLGDYLKALRLAKRMTLRQVERATDGFVSNAYLSQLEQGKRVEPGPKYLAALAAAYDVQVRLLFEKAGYADPPAQSEVEVAYEQVRADPNFKFGTRLKGDLDESAKRVIVELYQQVTGKKLLGGKPDDSELDRSAEPAGQ